MLINILMITINLFRYLIFHLNFHIPIFWGWGRSYRKRKWLRMLSVQHYCALATVSQLELLGSSWVLNYLSPGKIVLNYLFVKHFATNHSFGFPSCWDYTHSTDKPDKRVAQGYKTIQVLLIFLTTLPKQRRHTRPFQLQCQSCYPVDSPHP